MRPKKYLNHIRFKNKIYGKEKRESYSSDIMKNEPYFPKPLEYEDIDNAMFEFVRDKIDIEYNGKYVPTFTLYSNQRFSEYTQTWKHTDNDNNLLLNFKTVSRDNNPEPGENQGGLWNIPGDRFYTIRIRTVLDDNGNESYEIYSMKQPFSVDIMYQINFVTDKFEMINCFNQKLNDLFKARQCYIRPNEHYIPIVIDSVNDETTYSIDERKFFRQSFVIKAMAYIIKKEDFKVEKKPKRIMLFGDGDTFKPKPNINIDEYEDMYHNKKIELMINFKEYQDKVNFNIDTDMVVDNIILDNIRHFRMFVNDTPYYTDKGFKVNNNDDIKIKIFPIDVSQPSEIKFIGYDPSVLLKNDVPENVSDEKTQNEIIVI